MSIKFFKRNENIIVGITIKDLNQLEENNMALHTCLNEQHILKNRQQLAEQLNISLNRFVCANQTHSANFCKVEDEHIGKGATSKTSAIVDCDALYTFKKNIVLCSFTADCVPVLFHDPISGVYGAIHSGWQGTVKEISSKLLHHLKTVEKVDLSNLKVWIGPALSQQKFEVDEDVYSKFKALDYAEPFMYFNEETKKYHIDNQKTVQKQFELSGVIQQNIQLDRTCTFLDEGGFSYRQDKKCGRHLSFITVK